MSDEYRCDRCDATFFSRQSLGAHRGQHGRRSKYLPTPDCFNDDDWEFALTRLRIESPGIRNMTYTFALGKACGICPIAYMQEMQAQGRCRPPYGSACDVEDVA